MEPQGSLLQSQVPTTCPYPEPARSSPCPHIPLLKIHLKPARHFPLSCARCIQSTPSHSVSLSAALPLSSRPHPRLPRTLSFPLHNQTLHAFFCHSHVHIPTHLTILDFFTLVTSGNTNHEAPHYAVLSGLLLLSPTYAHMFSSAPCSRTLSPPFFRQLRNKNSQSQLFLYAFTVYNTATCFGLQYFIQ